MSTKNPFARVDPDDLKQRLADPAFVAELQKDPERALKTVRRTPLETDVWIYRIVVLALGLTVLLSVGGAIFLAARENATASTPEILVAIGSAAVGALAGLLAPAPGASAGG